jgi:chaperonin GroES
MSVETGDRVMFNKFAGTEVEIEGEEHLVMREDDIIACIES